ncbi:MAG TPA: thymidine kinase [Actinomycetota bacterium]|nr:thymidine kinase [Actinomycetota bacterium]
MEQTSGRVEVIAGPMFAGKTEELLRRVRRAVIAGLRVQVLTHTLDTRGGADRVASHVGLDYPSSAVPSAADIADSVARNVDVVAIDEAHFFGPELIPAVADLARAGAVVVVAGLDVTFAGEPFEPLPSLMALAERVDKLTAICTVCGAEAIFHARVDPSPASGTELVPEHVGGAEKYQALCRRHFRGPSPGER